MKKAVVFGGTLDGIEWALGLNHRGFDVVMITDTTFIGDDITKTWCHYGADRQGHTAKKLGDLCPAFRNTEEMDLLPGRIKRELMRTVCKAGIHIIYMSFFAGLWVQGEQVRGALIGNKFGIQRIEADIVIDATLFASACSSIAGFPIVIPKGSMMTYQLEYFGVGAQCKKTLLPNTSYFRGIIGRDHAYVQIERVCAKEMGLQQAQDYMRLEAAETARRLKTDLPAFECAYLAESLPSSIHTDAFTSPMIHIDGFYRCSEGDSFTELAIETAPVSKNNVSGNSEYILAGKRIPIDICNESVFNDPFYENMLTSIQIPIDKLDLPVIKSDVFIAGGGTAGVWAAISAAEQGLSTQIAEFFGNLGGTRTVGGVIGIYLEQSRCGLPITLINKIREYTAGMNDGKHVRSNTIAAEMMYYNEEFARLDIGVQTSCAVCEIKTSGENVNAILCVGQNGLTVYAADIYVDATGDGDLAVLAGVPTEYGDSEMACTQNYSQWFLNSHSPYDSHMPSRLDQGVMDSRYLSEWNRAIRYNYESCPDYDMVEMLTVRESRRIEGCTRVSLRDYIRNHRYDDVICEAYSDYDPHSHCFSSIGRLGLLPQHAPYQWVGIPYGAMLPRNIDNLLVLSKSMSFDQDMFNYTRMNPDVMTLGYVSGLICGQAAKQHVCLHDVELSSLQENLRNLGVLGNVQSDNCEVSIQHIAEGLINGDEDAFAVAVLAGFEEVVPSLLRAYKDGQCADEILILKTLLWFGETHGCLKLIERLSELNTKHGDFIYDDRNTGWLAGNIKGGIIGKLDDYWLMNQLVVILSKAHVTAAIDCIETFIHNTSAGGSPHNNDTHYISGRIDNQCIPNYDRVLCIAEAVGMMPSPLYKNALEYLLQKPYISGYCVKEGGKESLNFHMALMELKLAAAAAACGSDLGIDIVIDYTEDVHITLSRYASMRARSIEQEH